MAALISSKASLMIVVQSSGSMRSRIAVEPTTSANSAVTGLRSPVSFASRIFSMSGAGAADERRLRSSSSAGSAGLIALPQFEQKRASAGTDASQFGQKTDTGLEVITAILRRPVRTIDDDVTTDVGCA